MPQSVPVRAGIDFAERAYDRPSLTGLVQHQKAAVALDFAEVTPEGEAYTAHLYRTEFPFVAAGSPRTITITPIDPRVLVEIHGLTVLDANSVPHFIDLSNRAGLTRLNAPVLRTSPARPRAFVLPRAQAYSPGRHAGLTTTQLVASPDV